MNLTTVIGSSAAFLCLISYIPQIVKGYITKRLDDVSTFFMIILTIGVGLWFIYGSLRNDLIIMIANMMGVLFTLIILIMKYYYINKRNLFKPRFSET